MIFCSITRTSFFAAVQQANPCYRHALQYPSTLSVQHTLLFFLWAAALAGTATEGPVAAFILVCPVGVSVVFHMNSLVRTFLAADRFAVVGASANPSKFGNKV